MLFYKLNELLAHLMIRIAAFYRYKAHWQEKNTSSPIAGNDLVKR
jgi:hypothetical protein